MTRHNHHQFLVFLILLQVVTSSPAGDTIVIVPICNAIQVPWDRFTTGHFFGVLKTCVEIAEPVSSAESDDWRGMTGMSWGQALLRKLINLWRVLSRIRCLKALLHLAFVNQWKKCLVVNTGFIDSKLMENERLKQIIIIVKETCVFLTFTGYPVAVATC